MEEYEIVKSIKITEEQAGQKKHAMVCFFKGKRDTKGYHKKSGIKTGIQKYIEICITKTAVPKFKNI